MAKKPVAAKTAAAALKGEVAVVEGTGGPVASAAFQMPAGLKLKKLVTVPSLVLKNVGQSATLRIDSPIRVSKVVDKKDSKREPAKVCDVTDVTTGQAFIFLVPAVVQSNLERDYQNGEGEQDYVGRIFFFQNLGKRTESQRYNDFGIAELEAEEE